MQFNFDSNVTKSESPSIWIFEVSISIEVVVDLWKDSIESRILIQFLLVDKGFIACKELHRKLPLRVSPFCKANDALTCASKLEVRKKCSVKNSNLYIKVWTTSDLCIKVRSEKEVFHEKQ